MVKTYSEKLKGPRWQKKRLEILERDRWACKECGDKDNTLHVHHHKYAKSGNPWDADNLDLVTLCEKCHDKIKTKKDTQNKLDELLALFNKEELDFLLVVVYRIQQQERWGATLVSLYNVLENTGSLRMGSHIGELYEKISSLEKTGDKV